MPQEHTSAINVITISSQYGSEGKKIAMKLALRLHWLLVDQEISAQAAQQLDLTEEEAVLHNERTFGFVDRFLFSMRFSTPQALEAWAAASTMPLSYDAQERSYRDAQQRIVKTIADTGYCVIAGHAAQVILANRPDVLHIRIIAPVGQRIRYVMQHEHINEKEALYDTKHKERKLSHYLQFLYHCEINDPLLYDLIINGYALDVESQVDLICQTLSGRSSSSRQLQNMLAH